MFAAGKIKAIVEAAPQSAPPWSGTTEMMESTFAEVVSSAFVGVMRVQQHRLVYQALGDHMKQDIHALALKTYTPEQWPHEEG